MLKLNSIMIGTSQIDVMAKFYEAVIGRPADMVEQDWHGWSVGDCFLSIGAHSEVNGQAKEPQRLMFNFETAEIQDEFDRIKAIDGVEVVKEPYAMSEDNKMQIATLADPDGNYFQLMTPWEA